MLLAFTAMCINNCCDLPTVGVHRFATISIIECIGTISIIECVNSLYTCSKPPMVNTGMERVNFLLLNTWYAKMLTEFHVGLKAWAIKIACCRWSKCHPDFDIHGLFVLDCTHTHFRHCCVFIKSESDLFSCYVGIFGQTRIEISFCGLKHSDVVGTFASVELISKHKNSSRGCREVTLGRWQAYKSSAHNHTHRQQNTYA